jgi:predicted RNA-binding protein YlxR (DUF448 family)
MAKKKTSPRQKHVPRRTCVGCREVLPKRSLTRIVRTSVGIDIDPSGKMAGRGAYVHDRRSCWDRALKGALAQALRTELTLEDKKKIVAFIANLPDAEPVIED